MIAEIHRCDQHYDLFIENNLLCPLEDIKNNANDIIAEINDAIRSGGSVQFGTGWHLMMGWDFIATFEKHKVTYSFEHFSCMDDEWHLYSQAELKNLKTFFENRYGFNDGNHPIIAQLTSEASIFNFDEAYLIFQKEYDRFLDIVDINYLEIQPLLK